jgi:hypothetical protein
MPRSLSLLLGFLAPRPRTEVPSVPNEVLEHQGLLLVRLGRGSAMQVRIEPGGSDVRYRIVPIANATQLNGDSPWMSASDGQIRGWIHPDSAIGQWLMAKGLVVNKPKSPAFSGEWAGSMSVP